MFYLAHCLRRWPNINPTYAECLMFDDTLFHLSLSNVFACSQQTRGFEQMLLLFLLTGPVIATLVQHLKLAGLQDDKK